MRKTLLTSITGIVFLVCGMLVGTAQASNSVKTNVGKSVYQGITNLRSTNLITKYNKATLKLKKVCTTQTLDCGFFIQLSADAFDSMIAACNYNETSSACANAQTWIEIVMEATLDACSSAELLRKGDSLPVNNRLRSFALGSV